MTAPDTDLSRQRRRHRWPLLGIFLALASVGVLALVILSRSGDVPPDVPAGAVEPVMSDDPAARGSAAGDAAGAGGGDAGAPAAADGN